MKVIVENILLNIISIYSSQVSWKVRRKSSGEVRIRILIDHLNGHVGNDWIGYERVHEMYGFNTINEAGEKILDFALAYHLTILNI